MRRYYDVQIKPKRTFAHIFAENKEDAMEQYLFKLDLDYDDLIVQTLEETTK